MSTERSSNEIWAAARNALVRRADEIRTLCGLDIYIPAHETSFRVKISGREYSSLTPVFFELEPLVIYRLYAIGRLDLALEHEILAPEWETVLDSDMRARAQWNLATVNRFAYLDAIRRGGGTVSSEITIDHDPLVVAGNRVIWLSAFRSLFSGGPTGAPCEVSEQLELCLMSDPVIPYSAEHHRHVLFCQGCRSRAPLLTEVYERKVELDLKLMVGRLEALAAIQSLDEDRINEFLSRQKPEHREDWMHATELLGWRAIVAGEYLAHRIELQHLVPEADGRMPPAWSQFAAGNGHPKAVDLFRTLDPRLLRAGVTSMLLSRMYIDTYFDAGESLKIPTDGDLVPYAWAVPTTENADFDCWEELLGYVPRNRTDVPLCSELVEVVKMAASSTLTEEGERVTDSRSLDNDLLQNTHDMLWVTSQRIEQALPPTPEHARDSVLRHLGTDVFERLELNARQILVDAEWIFLTGRSPTASLREIAQAFEHHVRVRISPLVRDSLSKAQKNKGWIPSLSDIEQALADCSESERAAIRAAGLEPTAVANAIRRVRRQQADLKHRPGNSRISGEEAREIRETWYGLKPGVAGVFHLVTGSYVP